LHDISAEIERTSVMGAQHKEAQHLKVILLSDLTDCPEIPERFGHLPVVNIQERVVQPVARKNLSIAALALRDLIFMVREDQILAARMDINLLTEILL